MIPIKQAFQGDADHGSQYDAFPIAGKSRVTGVTHLGRQRLVRPTPAEGDLAKGRKILYFKEVKSKPQANEFRITGAGSESADAALHESMLQNEEAEAMADIAAVKAAITAGVPVETAVRLFAGELARAKLIAAGLLSE